MNSLVIMISVIVLVGVIVSVRNLNNKEKCEIVILDEYKKRKKEYKERDDIYNG